MIIETAVEIIKYNFGIGLGELIVNAEYFDKGWMLTLSSASVPIEFDERYEDDATISDERGMPVMYGSLDLAYEAYMVMCKLAYPDKHQYAVANTSFIVEVRTY